jgi:hypothetical protein
MIKVPKYIKLNKNKINYLPIAVVFNATHKYVIVFSVFVAV